MPYSDGVQKLQNAGKPINFYINFHPTLFEKYTGLTGQWEVKAFVGGNLLGTETFIFSC